MHWVSLFIRKKEESTEAIIRYIVSKLLLNVPLWLKPDKAVKSRHSPPSQPHTILYVYPNFPENRQTEWYILLINFIIPIIMNMNMYICKTEGVVWLPMKQLSTRDQMTQKLTTIGHRTAFNNEQSPYRIVSYKRPRNDKCKTIKTRKMTV